MFSAVPKTCAQEFSAPAESNPYQDGASRFRREIGRVKGKPVQIRYDLVTVMEEHAANAFERLSSQDTF